ncbi:MAG: 2-oxoacid:acceptor oxidoreductase family protein [Thermodesulfobacteriota bacterium]|nr:2-oxoacid:acceptor oxidoreductase family protein [Thermodesulfobacteriota bacterium]
MEEKNPFRDELFIAGLGGMGVLLIGSLLATAAFKKYEYVSWLPSYGVQPRGGLSECTAIFSEERISSPLLDQAKTVILMDGPQYSVMEPRVRSGGLMIVDQTGLEGERSRKDFQLLSVPARDTSISSFGEVGPTNLILLGVYIAATGAMPSEVISEELEKRFKKKENVLSRNMTAFNKGLEMGRT